MSFKPLHSLMLSSCLLFSLSTQAQTTNNAPYQNNYAQQIRHYQAPRPLTEDSLKSRLDAHINITKRQMAFEKKQAEDYAANFAQYQAKQADALKQMMAQAEKQRQLAIKRMEMQQQHILKQFSKYQVAKDTK